MKLDYSVLIETGVNVSECRFSPIYFNKRKILAFVLPLLNVRNSFNQHKQKSYTSLAVKELSYFKLKIIPTCRKV